MYSTFPIIIFFYIFCTSVTWAFIQPRFLPFRTESSPPGTDEAGDSLLLTPLLDAGKINEAKYKSWVQPAIGGIRSHAGYLTVNRTTQSHLYFWFIPKTNISHENANTPLILWLQGGPGCSSLFGMFSENGPFKVTKEGVVKRVHAWTNDYHMLYIDQPVGTGFSFTENEASGYIGSQAEAAEHLYEALNQFYKLFYKLKDHDFYISGESYAGKYVPSLAYKIHTANQQSPEFKIPLKGLMIGNGYMDPEKMLGYGSYLFGLGLIDKDERSYIESLEETIKYSYLSENWLVAYEYHGIEFDYIFNRTGFTHLYDYTRENFEGDETYVEFLAQDEIRRRIHAGKGKYKVCSPEVHQMFKVDMHKSVSPWIEELLEHYPILFYNGQFDIICAHPLTENVFRNLHWSGAILYGEAKREVWRVDNMVAGYYKVAGNLIDVLVRDASHMVPADQPRNMLKLVNMFIENRLRNNSTHVEKW